MSYDFFAQPLEDVAELSLTAGEGRPEKGGRGGVCVAQLVLQGGQHRIHLHQHGQRHIHQAASLA